MRAKISITPERASFFGKGAVPTIAKFPEQCWKKTLIVATQLRRRIKTDQIPGQNQGLHGLAPAF